MLFCGRLLLSCLLSVALLHTSISGFRDQPAEHVDRPTWRSLVGIQPHSEEVNAREELTEKLLQLEQFKRMENDVTDPKRKRSFPSDNAPLDHLSVGSMETNQGTKKQSKVMDVPRRQASLPPVDRMGMSRLPNGLPPSCQQLTEPSRDLQLLQQSSHLSLSWCSPVSCH